MRVYGYLGVRDAQRAPVHNCVRSRFDFPETAPAVAFVSGRRQRWQRDPRRVYPLAGVAVQLEVNESSLSLRHGQSEPLKTAN